MTKSNALLGLGMGDNGKLAVAAVWMGFERIRSAQKGCC